MHLPLFFASKYLVSKKSHNLINVISMISVGGLSVGTMALIVVLSVFNGFEEVIKSLYNSFNPDFKITATTGKTFSFKDFPAQQIADIDDVSYLYEVVEEDVLLRYNNQQYIARIKGVPKAFANESEISKLTIAGTFLLEEGDVDFAVPGAGVAWHLSINPDNLSHWLTVYVPKRGNASSFQFSSAFNLGALHPTGIFSVQQEFDEKYVFVPLRFAQQLLDYQNEVTSVEVLIAQPSFADRVQREIKQILGNDFRVDNRFEQNRALFKVLKSEKTIIFLILVFILLLSSFNMIGSLSILMIEKNKDMAILNTLGANRNLVKRIFLTEGVLITFAGSATGLFFGFVIILLQQEFGLLSLGGGDGSFVIESYPVKMVWTDFLLVFATVQAVGYFATWYPVRLMIPRLSNLLIK